jgi:ubiquinone/menaquinone biosynthesis C-methylase UbiE
MSTLKDPEGNETKYLRRFAEPGGKSVLEVGCGDGRLTWRYARDALRVAAIDLERSDLRVAVIERPSDLENRAAFLQANSTHLPFTKKSFDLAIFAWSF